MESVNLGLNFASIAIEAGIMDRQCFGYIILPLNDSIYEK
jgi:hypothetical protein